GREVNRTFTVHITSTTKASTGGDCEQTGLVDNSGHVSTTNGGSDDSSAEICVAKPVIHIHKTTDQTQVNAGDDIGFTMKVWNSGDRKSVVEGKIDDLRTNPVLYRKIAGERAGWTSVSAISLQDVLPY